MFPNEIKKNKLITCHKDLLNLKQFLLTESNCWLILHLLELTFYKKKKAKLTLIDSVQGQ